ncbi:MAG: hypothetical protein LBT06_15710 [Hungatella sp.]|jgi:hypothetical protein|nr:hypothetical protein [Hungatella sp.]
MFYQEKRKNQVSGLWKNSESALQVKNSVGREQKKELTGYDSYREKKDRIKESLRFENSYGTIAFGGDKRRGLTVLVSEKRRHNSPGITGKEKQLYESRHTERPMGRGKTLANAGGQREGAFAFVHQPEVSRFEMMERMKQYLSGNEQETVQRMMPFMKTKKDQERKTRLEEAARTMREHGMEEHAGRLNRVKEEKERLMLQKRQMEAGFNQKLVQAMKDVKKEPSKDTSRRSFGDRFVSVLLNALKQSRDETEEETKQDEKAPDSGPDEKKESGR